MTRRTHYGKKFYITGQVSVTVLSKRTFLALVTSSHPSAGTVFFRVRFQRKQWCHCQSPGVSLLGVHQRVTTIPKSGKQFTAWLLREFQLQELGFTTDSAPLQKAERQESTTSLHIALLPGEPIPRLTRKRSAPMEHNARWLPGRASDAPRIWQGWPDCEKEERIAN